MAKTLIDFRAEKGLYLKDVANAIDISEEELTKIETLNGIPDYIAEKLIVAYNLPEDYFAGEKAEQPIKPIKNLKSYFFKPLNIISSTFFKSVKHKPCLYKSSYSNSYLVHISLIQLISALLVLVEWKETVSIKVAKTANSISFLDNSSSTEEAIL